MTDSTPSHPQGKITSDLAQDNLNTVAEFEHRFIRERSRTDRLGEAMAGFTGSFGFIAFHVFWFTGWIIVNLGIIPGIRVFDRFP